MFNLMVLADLKEIGAEIQEYITQNLIPNWVSFVTQLGALIVMVLVVFFVGYKRVRKVMVKRAEYVENNIRESEAKKAEAENNAQMSEEALIASKKEAAEIIANAKVAAENNQRQMIEQTQLEVNKMKQLAEEDIERSKQEAREEVRQEMVSVALAASEEILKREINEKDNARIVEDFIKDID